MRRLLFWTLPISLHLLLPIKFCIISILLRQFFGAEWMLENVYASSPQMPRYIFMTVLFYVIFCQWLVAIPSYAFLYFLQKNIQSKIKTKITFYVWIAFWLLLAFTLKGNLGLSTSLQNTFAIVLFFLYLLPFTIFASMLGRGKGEWIEKANSLSWKKIFASALATIIFVFSAAIFVFIYHKRM